MNNKKAFSLVEIIIAISIILLLAVIGLSSKNGYDENMNNTKVISDIDTINNALEALNLETKTLPTPDGNTNFFKKDTSYAHSYQDAETFGVYGSITEKTIPKRFLEITPLDPRTKNYYSYGKTKESNQFELASIQIIKGKATAKVTGNYTGEEGPYNLIREYNGNNFVYNGSVINMPYNPEELVLIATDIDGNIYKQGDEITVAADGAVTKNTDTTVITTQAGGLEIFFSDGSVSILGTGSTLTLSELNFPKGNNLSSIVKLSLGAGNIWTRATQLSDDSEFQIYTQDSTAAVRGTIFGVVKGTNTEVLVLEGKVSVYEAITEPITAKLTDIQAIVELEKGKNVNSIRPTEINTNIDIVIPTFSRTIKIRDKETSSNIETKIISILEGNPNQSLINSGYTLEYYALYDEDIYLQKIGGTPITPQFDNLAAGTGSLFTGTLSGKTYNISTVGVNKGVYIDNSFPVAKDKLKYENLDLGNNFAIEMSIKGSALQRDGEFYLYDNGKIFLKMESGYLRMGYILGNGKTQFIKLINNTSLSTLNSKKFYKIIAIYNGKNGELKLNNLDTFGPGKIEPVQSLTNINIGSDSSEGNQWDGVIDYVKIYTGD